MLADPNKASLRHNSDCETMPLPVESPLQFVLR
ncbi:hypothetical protein Nmel_007798 [Mimus melanotis]